MEGWRDIVGRWAARGPPSPGPIKSVKIVWWRELCSLGDLPDDPGGNRETSGAGTGGLASAALWATLVRTLEAFCGRIKETRRDPLAWNWAELGSLPTRLNAKDRQSRVRLRQGDYFYTCFPGLSLFCLVPAVQDPIRKTQ